MYWIKKQEKHLLIHNTRTVGKLEKAVDGWKASWHSDSANKWLFAYLYGNKDKMKHFVESQTLGCPYYMGDLNV